VKKLLFVSLIVLCAMIVNAQCPIVCEEKTNEDGFIMRQCKQQKCQPDYTYEVPVIIPTRRLFVSNTWGYVGYENYERMGYNAGVTGGVFNAIRYRSMWFFNDAHLGQGKIATGGMHAGISTMVMYEYKKVLFGCGASLGKTVTQSWDKNAWGLSAGIGYMFDETWTSTKVFFKYIHSNDGGSGNGIELSSILTLWEMKIAFIPTIGFLHTEKEGIPANDAIYATLLFGLKI
jgi:hypothetical protein